MVVAGRAVRFTTFCCSLFLLENDPSVIEPDVLSKDRDKFESTGDPKYVDKAHLVRRLMPPNLSSCMAAAGALSICC